MKQKLQQFIRAVNARRKWIGIGAASGVAALTVLVVGIFFWPKTVTFSYAGQNCFFNPVVLPGLVSPQPSEHFTPKLQPGLSAGGFPLFSHTTCVTPHAAPPAQATEHIGLGVFGIFKKPITVTTGKPPVLTSTLTTDKPVATSVPLTFKLSQEDTIFEYELHANNNRVVCTKQSTKVQCNPANLVLAQNTVYEFTMQRVFNGQRASVVFKQKLKTVEALAIANTSISRDQTVFSVPAEIIVTLNKAASVAKDVKLESVASDGKRQLLPIQHSFKDADLIVKLEQPLPRDTKIELTIGGMEANDGAYLPEPFVLPFKTSGGPKVQGISIGSYRVAVRPSITLTFDSALGPNQPYGTFIQIESDGKAVAATVSANGKRATITPHASLGACATFTVRVKDGIKSDAGVTGGSAWQYASRTLCQTAFSIGASVQGRGIMAYRFGSGASNVVFVAGIHGNEKSSTYTMNSLIDHLEANPGVLPKNRTVTIIPIANPDGYAKGSRLNARNVDLNRNFPANNWKSNVTIPGGNYPTGGGTAPLSEPESKALASYITSRSTRLVMTYHAIGPLAAANEAGDSMALVRTYGRLAGTPAYGNSAGGSFDYDTTGALEDWLADKYGRPAIIVELANFSGNSFWQHWPGIKVMIQS